MSGQDWRHARGYRDRPATARLEAEVAADVAAYVAGGGRVQQIPMGVSGLDDSGMPRSQKRANGQVQLQLKRPEDLANTNSEIRTRMEQVRGRPRKQRLPEETVRAVLQAAQRMAVPVRTVPRGHERRAERSTRRRIAAEALALLEAPYSQIADALEVYGSSTVANWRSTLSETEALCARDLVREVSQ